jgi:hypothetical protein
MPPRSFIFRLLAEGISPSDVPSKTSGDIVAGSYTTYGSRRLPIFVKLALGLSPSESSWFTLTGSEQQQEAADKNGDETSWCIIKDGYQSQDSEGASGASVAGVCADQV